MAVGARGQELPRPYLDRLSVPVRRDLRPLGRRARKRFLELAAASRPLYGAITVEAGLATPDQLATGRPSFTLEDTYVSWAVCDELERGRLLERALETEVVECADGFALFTTAPFRMKSTSSPMKERETLSASSVG